MADDVNELGKNIAKGMMPFGGSEKVGKSDPLPLLKALQAMLGFGQQEQAQPGYNPNANEAVRRAQLEMLMKQQGSQNALPGQKAPQK